VVSSKTIHGIMFHLRTRFRGNGLVQQCAGDVPPLRSELFNSEQMEAHGKNLAGSHTLSVSRVPDQLLARLAENEGVLIGACDLLTEAVTANRRIAPAGEWLLDNFYLIEEQIRTARRHLPKGLPELERRAAVRLSPAVALQRMSRQRPVLLYLGTILLMTAILTGTFLVKAHANGVAG